MPGLDRSGEAWLVVGSNGPEVNGAIRSGMVMRGLEGSGSGEKSPAWCGWVWSGSVRTGSLWRGLVRDSQESGMERLGEVWCSEVWLAEA